ncbi:MAG: DUF4177 domain-containing protein [Candidatus Heimdallarchaeota archaeon]|nr:DUF4177 domain-containing protein [Candidatus Heimdallarchaeota archaeon]
MLDYWEYHYEYLRTRTDDSKTVNAYLSSMGEQGWELVAVVAATGGSQDIMIHSYYFKRRRK